MSIRPPEVWLLRHIAVSLALVVAAGQTDAGSQPVTSRGTWRITAGDVEVRCRLTVGGSFTATTSNISGFIAPPPTGETLSAVAVTVELSALDTGISLRNHHLRNRYLTVTQGPQYRQAQLSALRLETPLSQVLTTHRTGFVGTLLLHGIERGVTGTTEIRRVDRRLQVEAKFDVSLNDFDIPSPQYLGVGVRNEVTITVSFIATRETP
jgi:polyisoprenoid-binding protein YceI